LERYISAIPAVEAALPAFWDPASRELLKGSTQFGKAEEAAAEAHRGAAAIFTRLPDTVFAEESSNKPTLEEFVAAFIKASALVSTRAFQTGCSLGAVLCPVLDFLNHTELEKTNAGYRFTDEDFSLEALKPVRDGKEILVCYDKEADYLDMWERYGFFDTAATIHTVEILIPSSSALFSSLGIGPFWIPENHFNVPLTCPLRTALTELAQASLGAQASEEQVDQHALLQMANLIRSHLGVYPDWLNRPNDDTVCAGDLVAKQPQAARKVLLYERDLLASTLGKIEGLTRGALSCATQVAA